MRANAMTTPKSHDDRFISIPELSDETWELLMEICELTPGLRESDIESSPVRRAVEERPNGYLPH
ncbi:hypothetical protein AC731_006310 [Thauera humireducens]|uniref:Uncharacterized protein n=2 Tax=Thauera humireducens TaxID=1134435 RepID=A0A127K3Q5_9RHOO|nr:hypothetical protein AC731_006310 [Thauera humireducens]